MGNHAATAMWNSWWLRMAKKKTTLKFKKQKLTPRSNLDITTPKGTWRNKSPVLKTISECLGRVERNAGNKHQPKTSTKLVTFQTCFCLGKFGSALLSFPPIFTPKPHLRSKERLMLPPALGHTLLEKLGLWKLEDLSQMHQISGFTYMISVKHGHFFTRGNDWLGKCSPTWGASGYVLHFSGVYIILSPSNKGSKLVFLFVDSQHIFFRVISGSSMMIYVFICYCVLVWRF